MAIGTALAIALAVKSGLDLVAAKKQSTAGKDAAKIQSASADKAIALQREMADRALQAQNQAFYGNQGGGNGSGQGGPMNNGGGIQGAYNPYLNSGPATLSALHAFLNIPGASQNQTAVPSGAYGPPMGQPMTSMQPPMPPGGSMLAPSPTLSSVSGMAGLANRAAAPGMSMSNVYQRMRGMKPQLAQG